MFDREIKIANGSFSRPWSNGNDLRFVARYDATTLYVWMLGTGSYATDWVVYKSTDNGDTWTYDFTVKDSAGYGPCNIRYDAYGDQFLFGMSCFGSEAGQRSKQGFKTYDIATSTLTDAEYAFNNPGPGISSTCNAPVLTVGTNYLNHYMGFLEKYSSSKRTFRVKERTGIDQWTSVVYDSKVDDNCDIKISPPVEFFTGCNEGDIGNPHYFVYLRNNTGLGLWKHIWLDSIWLSETLPFTSTGKISVVADSTGKVYFCSSQSYPSGINAKVYCAIKESGTWGTLDEIATGYAAQLVLDKNDNVFCIFGHNAPGDDSNKLFVTRHLSGGWLSASKISDKVLRYISADICDDYLEVVAEEYNSGNTEIWYYSQPLDDNKAPWIDRCDPYDGETGISRKTDIRFYINDLLDGVDLDSVKIEIDYDDGNGFVTVWEHEADVGGYGVTTVLAEFPPNSCHYTFNSILDFAASKTISVRVNAQDLHGTPNIMSPATWNFVTGTTTFHTPYIANYGPLTNEVATDGIITFDILDLDDDVDTDTITFSVKTRSYKGSLSSTVNVITANFVINEYWAASADKITNGYRITISKLAGLDEKTQYICTAHGHDDTGLTCTKAWTFWTTWTSVYNHDLYVDSASGSDLNIGDSWGTALATIEEAIDRLRPTYTVYIDEGTGYTVPTTVRVYGTKVLRGSWYLEGFHNGTVSNPTRILARSGKTVQLNAADSLQIGFTLCVTQYIEIGNMTSGWLKITGVGAYYLFEVWCSQNIKLWKGQSLSTAAMYGGFMMVTHDWRDETGMVTPANPFYNKISNIQVVKPLSRAGDTGGNHFMLANWTTSNGDIGSEVSIYHATCVNGGVLFGTFMGIMTDYAAIFINGTIDGTFTNLPATPGIYGFNNSYPDINNLGAGTLNVDPLFTNSSLSDYTLTSISPLIDKGVIVFGINDNYSGLAPDIGCFEYEASVPVTGIYLDNGGWFAHIT